MFSRERYAAAFFGQVQDFRDLLRHLCEVDGVAVTEQICLLACCGVDSSRLAAMSRMGDDELSLSS